MANEKTPVVWDDDAKKHRPLGSGEKMGGLSASSMISSDSGNLLQQGSDGLMLVTGSSLADPRADNLLEESENGKLQVTSDRVVEWLEGHPQAAAALADAVKVVSGDEGNVIVAGTDKGAFMSKEALTSAVSEMTPAQMSALADALRKAGGGLNVDPTTGKLVVDFGSMDPAIMRNVVLSMVQQGGGISVDGQGKLYVDFDNMPTAKFEALLKSLKMQIPLTANMDLFVDGANGSDAIVEGRGTEALPFKTIQACVTYATQTYAVGVYTLTIRVKPGTYTETVNLPAYTRTSGQMVLAAYSDANPPLVTPALNTANAVDCRGYWLISRLAITANRTAQNDGLNYYPALVYVTGGGYLTMRGVSLVNNFLGAAPSSGRIFLKTFAVDGNSTLALRPMPAYGTSIEVYGGNSDSSEVFTIYENSHFYAYSTNDAQSVVDISVSGDFTTFVNISAQSLFRIVPGALYTPSFTVPSGSSATGKKYAIAGSSGISLPLDHTLPGSIAGTVDSGTYSWYSGGE